MKTDRIEGKIMHDGSYYKRDNQLKRVKSNIPRSLENILHILRRDLWPREYEYLAVSINEETLIASLVNKTMNLSNGKTYHGEVMIVSKEGEIIQKPRAPNLKSNEPFYFVSNFEFQNSISNLVDTIKNSREKFDCIVAIPRSGFIPATFLAYSLGIENIFPLCSMIYPKHKLKKVQDPFKTDPLLINGKNVLLVDSVADSGRSLQINKKLLDSYQPKLSRTLVTHYLPTTEILPDFSAVRINNWNWVSYSWDIKK